MKVRRLVLLFAMFVPFLTFADSNDVDIYGQEETINKAVKRHFSWGADVGSSIDLSGNDFSTFDVHLNIGYTNNFIRLVGVGAGIHRAFGAGNNFIPIYVIFRSSFRSKPSLFFLDWKAGYSFNSISDADVKGGFQMSAGLGINLYSSNSIKSHIILGYGYFHLNEKQTTELKLKLSHINLVQLSFGIVF
jgi:hypothetical protein